MRCVKQGKGQVSVAQVLRMNEDKVFSHEAASSDFGYTPKGFGEAIRGEVEEYLQRKRLSF